MRYEFSGYSLDDERREFLRHDKPVAIEPQVFDLLLYLVQNRHRVVTRDDLIGAIWGGRTVSHSAVTTRINAVRRAVGDTSAAQAVIRTMTRSGIRFIAPVIEVDAVAPPKTPTTPLIAVYPFVATRDSELKDLADALTRDITVDLLSIPDAVVTTSLTWTGRTLGVDCAVAGVVGISGTRAWAKVQLLGTNTSAPFWERTFEDEFADVSDIVTREIAARLGVELIPARKEPRKKRLPRSVEQRPAAYKFTSQGDKIDVLPEPPEPLDRQLAEDTQQELLAKARDLLNRLRGTNSAQRVCDSAQRLLDALDINFNDLRPGVLLSRVRSLEADRAAFDTEDARAELFSDAFAIIDDAVQTARDLLAVFPVVRQIERERLALELDWQPEAIPHVEQQAVEIQEAAEKSGAATDSAIKALAQNDAAIKAATDPVLRNSLIADKLLVASNFVRAAAGKVWEELSELGAASWGEVKENLPAGIGTAARVAPLMALMTLATWIAWPVGGLAAAAPIFKPLAALLKKKVGQRQHEKTPPLEVSAQRRSH
jgi:DNA-binding winged helix-turn-helix (wHTH) protein